MNLSLPLPTPPELAQSPQLAILALLEFALELAIHALIAQHPQLCDHERPYWIAQIPSTPSSVMAEAILSTADSLKQSVDDYRHFLRLEIDPGSTGNDLAEF